MKKLLPILLFLAFGCSALGPEDYPDRFWANVQFENRLNSENVDIKTYSVKAEMRENEGGVDPGTKIWISYADEVEGGVVFYVPSSIREVGIKIERTEGNRYDFVAYRDPSVIDFVTP